MSYSVFFGNNKERVVETVVPIRVHNYIFYKNKINENMTAAPDG